MLEIMIRLTIDEARALRRELAEAGIARDEKTAAQQPLLTNLLYTLADLD